MNSQPLIRLGGLSALLSGVFALICEIGFEITVGGLPKSDAGATREWVILIAFICIATMLAVLGLIALFARQAKAIGKIGVVAFTLALTGTMMVFGHQWTGLFVVPVLAEGTPDFLNAITSDTTTLLASGVFLSIFWMAVGWFLFGLISLRARILPTGSVWLVMIGALLMLVLSMVNFGLDKAVFNLGLIWMGWWLWSERI
jgi:hypothetical protein